MSLAAFFATAVSKGLIEKVARGLRKRYTSDPQIKEQLGDLLPDVSELSNGITRMLIEGILDFGEATKASDFTSSLIGRVTNAARRFQGNAGGKLKRDNGLFGRATIKRLLSRPGCGGDARRPLDPGPPIEVLDNGRHVMRYFIEGLPRLGTVLQSRIAFMTACESWANELNIEFSQEVEDPENANLLVKHEVLRGVPENFLALTDIGVEGPNTGGQLIMVFDAAVNESWTMDSLQATAAHELGHALGIRHRDVQQPNQLMNDTLDTRTKVPQEFDVRAAVSKGWMARR